MPILPFCTKLSFVIISVTQLNRIFKYFQQIAKIVILDVLQLIMILYVLTRFCTYVHDTKMRGGRFYDPAISIEGVKTFKKRLVMFVQIHQTLLDAIQ